MSDVKTCKLLLARLQRHDTVAAPELKRALGEECWTDYQMLLGWAKKQRDEARVASYELRDYVRLLRIADLCDSRPHRNSKPRRGRGRSASTSPSAKYEQALRRLSELIEGNSSLSEYLDRLFWPYCWNSDSDISPEKECVPRLWFHTENALPQCEERQIKTVRQIKMQVLQGAIDAHRPPHRLAAMPRVKPLRRLKTR